MPEMSDLYIFVCLRVTGKNLEAETTNRVIDQYNERLRECKIEEQREDGKVFKAWVSNIDEFNHELISKDVLICSRRVRFEVRDPFFQDYDNRLNSIQAKIHKALMALKARSGVPYTEEIVIETMATHITGNMREGRWPRDQFDQLNF